MRSEATRGNQRCGLSHSRSGGTAAAGDAEVKSSVADHRGQRSGTERVGFDNDDFLSSSSCSRSSHALTCLTIVTVQPLPLQRTLTTLCSSSSLAPPQSTPLQSYSNQLIIALRRDSHYCLCRAVQPLSIMSSDNGSLAPLSSDSSSPASLVLHERRAFLAEVEEEAARRSSARWQWTERPYSASAVVSLRSSGAVLGAYAGARPAERLWSLLSAHFSSSTFAHTFGCLDPVQAALMAPHLSTLYVSGWQCSSTASSTNEPGPDLADYAYDTVPRKVDQLFRAQLFHAAKQRERRMRALAATVGSAACGDADERVERERPRLDAYAESLPPFVEYMRPIVADCDAGHGGVSAVMRLTKLMVEAGAAGIHFEDQKHGQSHARPHTRRCSDATPLLHLLPAPFSHLRLPAPCPPGLSPVADGRHEEVRPHGQQAAGAYARAHRPPCGCAAAVRRARRQHCARV